MRELINHVYIATSLFLAVIIGFFTDFMNEEVYYILGIVLVITAFVFAFFDNTKKACKVFTKCCKSTLFKIQSYTYIKEKGNYYGSSQCN